MKIIHYCPEFTKAITELFYKAVHNIDPKIYSLEQQQAWAPLPIDYPKWEKRLVIKKPYVFLIKDKVAGFIELEADGYIDCLYVLPEFQGQGVARALLYHVITLAKARNGQQLFVDASVIAKPFFKKHGFICEQKNQVVRNDVELDNYTMRLNIMDWDQELLL